MKLANHPKHSLELGEALNLPTAQLRLQLVIAVTGICRSGIYRMMAEGTFPKPMKIGYMVRWRSSDVSDWLAAQKPAAKAVL